jgi:PHD/YefM family antitoxin component YafN of YafNO toxin-antitoxin module
MFLPAPSPAPYTLSMNEPRARVLIPRRLSATNARPVWVRLLREVAEDGLPLEITRRHKPSVLLVRASDFEAALGRSHPWSELRAQLSPGSFHPNGLQPGVTHGWEHASSTWVRDHFCSVLKSVDTTGHPLMVTRRGHCGLMLLARRIFEIHWDGTSVNAQDGVRENAGGRLS